MVTGYDSVMIWVIIVAAGIGTFVLKFLFFLIFSRINEMNPIATKILNFVPAAVLAALVAPSILVISTELNGTLIFDTPKLIAGVIAGAVAYRTNNALWTISVGLLALWTANLVL
ncbi:AzlD domain-containing protein [Haladaptatus paucihalophilus]|nr:AzlD domain-containing protein [Haladaptatus paucihalophilus]